MAADLYQEVDDAVLAANIAIQKLWEIDPNHPLLKWIKKPTSEFVERFTGAKIDEIKGDRDKAVARGNAWFAFAHEAEKAIKEIESSSPA